VVQLTFKNGFLAVFDDYRFRVDLCDLFSSNAPPVHHDAKIGGKMQLKMPVTYSQKL